MLNMDSNCWCLLSSLSCVLVILHWLSADVWTELVLNVWFKLMDFSDLSVESHLYCSSLLCVCVCERDIIKMAVSEATWLLKAQSSACFTQRSHVCLCCMVFPSAIGLSIRMHICNLLTWHLQQWLQSLSVRTASLPYNVTINNRQSWLPWTVATKRWS